MVRCLVSVAALAAVAGSAHAGVTEISVFRQLAARARYGSFQTPTVDAQNNTNETVGVFNDTRTANVPTGSTATATATQNTSVFSGLYSGLIQAQASTGGNSGGTADASTSYGPAGDSFATTFAVAFEVDVPTLARFTGSAVATRAGSGGSIICQALLGDVLNGSPQPATIFAQPTANSPMVSWDQQIMLMPGHRYSFVATVNASQSNTFSPTGGTSTSIINFDITIPTPATASLLGMAGLAAMRRRRR